jgi:CDP-diacylglycerol---glycerol-3-phosphate 3-phosphatidyltransferase
MKGIDGHKPFLARQLAGVRAGLINHRVSPNVITAFGALFAVLAGVLLAVMPIGTGAGVVVTLVLAARLACTNLDGDVARATGRTSRFGSVVNDVGDHFGEIAVFGGLAFRAPILAVALAAFAATLPSWVSLAGAVAGVERLQGGPMGKIQRGLLIGFIAGLGFYWPLLTIIAAGSVLTAVLRLGRLHSLLISDVVVTAEGVLAVAARS